MVIYMYISANDAMTYMNFDLVSDLHADDQDWSCIQPTSPICVAAGDLARDREVLRRCLTDLGQRYETVLYVDGNDEHRHTLTDLQQSYRDLRTLVETIPNVVWLQDRIVTINDVAFVGTNAWWTFDLDPNFTVDETMQCMAQYLGIDTQHCDSVLSWAIQDAGYLASSVRRLQVHLDVTQIVLVTHSVPDARLIQSDPDLAQNFRINTTVNTWVDRALREDTEQKVTTWCFGHYHHSRDEMLGSVRYVSNPRGRLDTPWHVKDYRPLQVTV